ncbi:tricarboxylate transporter [Canicola haemoglobinophilus]|uniref:Tripartite tricarboxylate transporter TctB family n=1 Tax=Canicola haemoglobinophilus TaxID=733 RepID=A0A1V4AZH9_9PAST|nr:tripartite tricarboxylate transporter TctB family protein [Canicola haemoglobinophilus]OOR98559.1 tricarboxylate transporter [Canicola haemoglobinophilus]STO55143.1 Tripartite tricarboxylate transporter TctB family [Canicola haemoglobinophilus]STO59630.1 Tripartite tricarboxylate transporter TctB family [Canicola haemoglobinophilus]STO69286.1 Tripartite tricarboxylate transporter TctB family [Canicola haemoglobinophilus]
MTIRFRQDLVGSIVFLIFSLVLWFLIPYQIKVTEDDELITAQTFPRLVIGLMILCCVILFIQEIIKVIRKQPTKMAEINLPHEARSLVVVLLLVLYWGLLHWLPFIVSSTIFSVLLLIFFQCKNWKYYAIVIAVIVSVSLFFQNLLNVSLP